MSEENVRQIVKSGDVIAGKYRVEGVLGSGGMAVVLSATQLDLERLVAIKVMRAELAEVPGAVQRLLLEAKLTARFRNEHICKVLDVGTLPNGSPYVVMEYLEGSDLNGLLAERGAFDIVTAVDFIMQACEGIAEAHAADIVHRDLKPENLFVTNLFDDTPTVKVLDFGISKQIGARTAGKALTNPSAALGSPYYMAPEQMLAAKDADLRVDVWAIGSILFELLTARTPFDGDTLPEVCAAVMHATPKRADELRPEVPRLLADAIDRCLQKAPSDRFSCVAELARKLAPFGSPKAAVSLKRIERVLARKTPVAELAASVPELLTVGVRELTPGGAAEAQHLLDGKDSGTTGAAGVMMSSPMERRSRWKVVVLVGSLAVGFTALAMFARGTSPAARAEVPRAAAAGEARRPETPPPALMAPARAAIAMEIPAHNAAPPETETVASSSPRATRTHAPRVRHVSRLGKQSQPVPPVAAAVQSAEAQKTHKVTEAWDPSSFGPRR